MAMDGLWARLRGKAERVVLMMTDTITGMVWPPIVVRTEGMFSWKDLFLRAQRAGLSWEDDATEPLDLAMMSRKAWILSLGTSTFPTCSLERRRHRSVTFS